MKKRIKITESQLKRLLKNNINEQAFNDAGEPLMTHQQYRDYSEPYEPEYDDRNDYDEYDDKPLKSLQKSLENENVFLETYNGNEYFIRTKDNSDFTIYMDENGYLIVDDGDNENKFESEDDVLNYVLEKKDLFLSYDESVKEYEHEMEIERRDTYNNRMERSAEMGGY